MVAGRIYLRVDITNDKRYTLSEHTRQLLKHLDRGIGVDIFLGGKPSCRDAEVAVCHYPDAGRVPENYGK